MRRGPRLRSLCAVASLVLLAPVLALGQSDPARLDEAKEFFRRGVSLLTSGDTERALEAFLRSRELVPSGKNTANAAICLERLGRLDEALEMYEEVLTRFSADLDAEDRENLAPVMAALRQKIGYLELSANVDGLVVVDGRARGKLPLQTALRLLPGTRTLRVVKDGYRTFEQRVVVSAGRTHSLDATLEPLAGLGAVRIETSGDYPVEAYVDGRRVGSTPWEGTLSGGKHVVQTIRGNAGSAPERLDIIEGRTILLRVSVKQLGGNVTVTVNPNTAEVLLGNVPLGKGQWTGRLPLGRHDFRAREAGYVDGSTSIVAPAQTSSVAARIDLVRDPNHPRWPTRRVWSFDVGAAVGLWYAPTLNAGADELCPGQCSDGRGAWGAVPEVTGAAEHTSGFGGELALGYLWHHRSFGRVAQEPFEGETATFALEQEAVAHGPVVSLRGRMRLDTSIGVDFTAKLGGGLFFARYETAVEGVAWTNASPVNVATTGTSSVNGASPFVSAAFGALRRFGPLAVHAAFGAWLFPGKGPDYDGPTISVPSDCSGSSPDGSIGCVPESDVLVGERAHGVFLSLVPEIGVQYSF